MRTKQHKNAQSEAKAFVGNKSMAFLLEEIYAIKKHLKPPEKGSNSKKRKAESLLSMEINLTNLVIFSLSFNSAEVMSLYRAKPKRSGVLSIHTIHKGCNALSRYLLNSSFHHQYGKNRQYHKLSLHGLDENPKYTHVYSNDNWDAWNYQLHFCSLQKMSRTIKIM
jgi:hypothetical protein